MLYLVIGIALLNLGLGFAAGVTFHSSRCGGVRSGFRLPFNFRRRGPSAATADPVVDDYTAEDEDNSPLMLEQIVEQLSEQLQQYRVALSRWDGGLRARQDSLSTGEASEQIETLRRLNDEYILLQHETLARFHSECEGIEGFSTLIEELTRGLNQLTSDAEATDIQLSELDLITDPGEAAQQALQFIGGLMERLYAVQRQLDSARLSVARQRQRGNLWPESLRWDRLTGAHNRYGLEATIQEWWAADLERRRPLCLVAMGIDWFEQFNRSHGPEVADNLLCQTASLIQENLRPGDTLSRISGGAFAICLKETTVDGGVPLVERIRRLVDGIRFRHDSSQLKVSLSAGVTPAFGSDTFDELLERAQKAIGTARAHGGNRVYVAEDTGPAEPIQISDEIAIESRTIDLITSPPA